ncbi:beta-ketoacyl synthase N-terminal-like domain-containing protein [Amycolatopsis sp. NPDC058986]|uniref:beta-ketoacyl synthase N-terminal-like domain-containing protein n=1 Tax=unclassified Amycolatopsis TaxID=2618356 RepID=UPI00366FD0FD
MTSGTRRSEAFSTFSALFDDIAGRFAERVAIRFIRGDDNVEEWTYAQLARRVRGHASVLAERYRPGTRALLLLPSNLDHTLAFLAAGYAGLIAVPVHVPESGMLKRVSERLDHIISDAEPGVLLSTRRTLSSAAGLLAPHHADTLAVDELPSGDIDFRPPARNADDLLYLQYSSGSTRMPKAVCDTHAALLFQVGFVHQVNGDGEPIHMVSWLPLYHDMGMIMGLLAPILSGGTFTFMTPATFTGDPRRWFTAISRYRGTWSGGPDFSFTMSCKAFSDDELAELDLRSVRYFVNGAEPVRPETLDRVRDRFRGCGLDPAALTPAYGLAEAGLIVSFSREPRGYRVGRYAANALTEGRAEPVAAGAGRAVVGCGDFFHRWRVAIADPRTGAELPERRIGEIWVAGDGLPSGYWNRPQETQETFHATLPDGSGPYLRTGDLGFLDNNELFVCGRLKDLIIIRGGNHHPNDLEMSVEREVDAVKVGAACAVQLAEDGRLVLFAEVDRHLPAERLADIARQIRATIVARHDIVPEEVVLIRRRLLLRTSSGKIRRQATGQRYRDGALETLMVDRLDAVPGEQGTPVRDPAAGVGVFQAIHESLCGLLGRTTIGPDERFAELGMDSALAVRWAHQLGERLGRPVPVASLYRFNDLRGLSRALADDTPGADRQAPEPTTDAVAIIGVGLRLPGGHTDFDSFARWLPRGENETGPAPRERAELGVGLTLPMAALDDIDRFDAGFFGLGGAEAQAMDPQHRLLLETTWHALEHAYLPAHRLRDQPVGVFVGQGNNDYAALPIRAGRPDWVRAFYAQGNSLSSAAGRIAYHFGFRGPAIAVDTACSGSLVAVDTAVRYLRDSACDLAVAGGVNVALSPEMEQSLLAAGMLSPRGRCSTLSADADGYGRGEGVVLFVLRPLRAALRAGDRVLGVIRGSAVAQDGPSGGLAVPNAGAQAGVIRSALAAAGLRPDDIDAVELHGTGTPLGDPIEVEALREVHGARSRPLLLGSVKTNIGHLEAAAGAAGMVRALVSLRDDVWPGSGTFTGLNPELRTMPGTFRFPAETAPIPDDGRPRRIGVSSFGFTGTIAHLVLERAETAIAGEGAEPSWLGWIPVSGATETAARARARALARTLAGRSEREQADLLTLWRCGRDHHLPCRAVVTAFEPAELVRRLDTLDSFSENGGSVWLTIRLRAGDPIGSLLAMMRSWLPAALWPAAGRPGAATLLAVLAELGLRPDALVCDEPVRAELAAAGVAAPFVDRAPEVGLLLGVGGGDLVGTVALDPADGGRTALTEAYLRGAPLDWPAVDSPTAEDRARLTGPRANSPLPLYPFQRQRHWYPMDAAIPVPAPPADSAPNGALFTVDTLRDAVAELIGIPPETLGENDDLINAGLDSIMVMDLAAKFGHLGIQLEFDELFDRPTLAAWVTLVTTNLAADVTNADVFEDGSL